MKSQHFSILQRIREEINQLLSSLSADFRDLEEPQRYGYLSISPVFQKTLLSSNISGEKKNLTERILRVHHNNLLP